VSTGLEHYRLAERLIAAVTLFGTHPDGSPIIRSDEPHTIALAQVHATLALAAATGIDRIPSTACRRPVDRVDAPSGDRPADANANADADPAEAASLLDVGGYLPCGCHGSQREHTCGPLD
jgi:hypothetical protein